MNNRVIVIHSSEIISQGLFSIIKSLFDIEIVMIPAIDDLKNYNKINSSQILILVDSGLDQQWFSNTIESFDKTNSIKIVRIKGSSDKSDCEDDCNCCLPVHSSKSKIFNLLNPFLQHNIGTSIKRNSNRLTEREIDVLKIVAYGKTNKEIVKSFL